MQTLITTVDVPFVMQNWDGEGHLNARVVKQKLVEGIMAMDSFWR